jgi:hypothetical protein
MKKTEAIKDVALKLYNKLFKEGLSKGKLSPLSIEQPTPK